MTKDVLILSNKKEADKVYLELKAIMNRAIVFYSDVNEALPWINVRYRKDKDRFELSYSQEYFNRLVYGTEVPFYLPEWADVIFNLKNLEVYTEYHSDRGLIPNKVRLNTACFNILYAKGKYILKKEAAHRNTFCFDRLTIDTVDKFYELEDIIDYIYAGNFVEFDLSKMGNIYMDGTNNFHLACVSMFRTLQACVDILFDVSIKLHICEILTFFRCFTAFNITTSLHGWKRGPVHVYVNTSMRGREDYKNDHTLKSKLCYDGPHKMSFKSAYKSITNCITSAKITGMDEKHNTVYIESKSGVTFVLHCDCMGD